jgi:hypothetical protein
LLIIEDIHRNYNNIVYILERIKNKNTKFIVTGRKSFEKFIPEQKKGFLDRFEIKQLEQKNFETVAEDIISKYLKHENKNSKHEKKSIPQEKRKLIIKESRGNLWVLAYYLKGWIKDKGISRDILYDEIKKDIENLEYKYNVKGASDVLLALSPFSIFEIGVSKVFFDKDIGMLKFDDNTICELEKNGEILFNNGYYSIPHSTLARLYLETSMYREKGKNHTVLISKIRKQLKNIGFSGNVNKYVLEMLQLYLLNNPDNLSEFSKLTRDPEGINYWFEILQNKRIYNELIRQINEFEMLDELGKFISWILKPKERIKILEDIDWKALYLNFRNAQLWEIREFIFNTIYIYPSPEYDRYEIMIYKIFVDNISVLKTKLEESSIEERMHFTISLVMTPFNKIVFPLIKLLDLHTLIIGVREDLVKCEEEWKKLKKETATIKIKYLDF